MNFVFTITFSLEFNILGKKTMKIVVVYKLIKSRIVLNLKNQMYKLNNNN